MQIWDRIRNIKIMIPLPGLARFLFGDRESAPIRAGPENPEYSEVNKKLETMNREEKERAAMKY